MNENIKSEFFAVQHIRYLNFWLLGLWFILRLLSLIFSYIYVIILEVSTELNPIGFNYILIIVTVTPIFFLLIFNYRIHEDKRAIFLIFFVVLFSNIIQVFVTINDISGGRIGALIF